MECKKCGKLVDEYEIYCNDCKELLKKEKELTNLIDKNKQLNKLEITKELDTLENFKDEKNEDSSRIKEELKDIVNIGEIEENDKDKKIIIIVIASFISLLLVAIILTLFVFTKPKKVEKIETINYEKIINDYGVSIKTVVNEYLENNENVPSWSDVSDLIVYDNYEVICDVHHIYKDGSIYLNDCKVDDKKVENSYGVKKEEEKEGKKIEIYKVNYENNYYGYDFNNIENSQLIGYITCKTENCEYIAAYDKYTLIKESNEYYIYNYETNFIEFGPFNISNNNYLNNIISYNHILYGVLYDDGKVQNIYNISTSKTLKNIEGSLLTSGINFNPNVMYKYGYAAFNNGDKTNFINLKSGNVSYIVNGNIYTFIEDTTKNLVYILTRNSENSKITIYNSNGKKLFNGKEFNKLLLNNGEITVSTDTIFYTYDSDLKIKVTSKEYNSVLGLYEDFVVVVDNEYLEIVDLNDNILATFDLKWSSEYELDNLLTGKFTEDNKEIIYVVINNGENSSKYYYDLETKDFGLK